jgi:hypothetical protein
VTDDLGKFLGRGKHDACRETGLQVLARLVRANGDRWTLIGRTDGPVLLLTDALPGIPIDIDDAPRLQDLLTALTAAAERAAR